MKPSRFFSYAAIIVLAAGGVIWYIISDYYARQEPVQQSVENQVVMYKNPNCQCCTKWAAHLEEAGFTVSEQPTQQMSAVKANYKVPYNMGSCHTAIVDGYVIEGHVPAKEVKRLLKERPDAIGLAVPGMPVGSPGMEQGNRTEPYDVLLFGEENEKSTFASY
ncbi:DUF411 domain-containing protein [Fodinibius salsisoli]|uniref:DUF411 domain-containing protein n=1 Tax=Fodinibius salsisoli TaxID=2820877 RepID=A0ABT3PI21_9BACT|nr:DUF411 domain-containing protein [Fodinibius salsisoli]MCW9705433.1 DUF411 domain-containing protein [Fodinibius salsisoli]